MEFSKDPVKVSCEAVLTRAQARYGSEPLPKPCFLQLMLFLPNPVMENLELAPWQSPHRFPCLSCNHSQKATDIPQPSISFKLTPST